jgi:hypothetical protein
MLRLRYRGVISRTKRVRHLVATWASLSFGSQSLHPFDTFLDNLHRFCQDLHLTCFISLIRNNEVTALTCTIDIALQDSHFQAWQVYRPTSAPKPLEHPAPIPFLAPSVHVLPLPPHHPRDHAHDAGHRP